MKENLQVKEVIVGDGEARKRYILVHNPEEAERDKSNRERAQAEIGELNGAPHTKAPNVIEKGRPRDQGH